MEKFREVLNYLLSEKNIFSVALIIMTIGLSYFATKTYIYPKFQKTQQLKADLSSSKDRYNSLVEKKKQRDLEEKRNIVKFDKVPVTFYHPENKELPVESSSIQYVSNVIAMIGKTGNNILDISYNVKTSSDTLVPANVSVVELVMTLNGSYTSFQDFIYDLYGNSYISAIKSLKMTPLKENKNMLNINVVLQLYVSTK